MGLRFRLYGLERMRRERMIGESVIGFASLNLLEPSTHWVILEPRSNLSVSPGFRCTCLLCYIVLQHFLSVARAACITLHCGGNSFSAAALVLTCQQSCSFLVLTYQLSCRDCVLVLTYELSCRDCVLHPVPEAEY